jgi:hypothetical protein
MSHPPSFPAGLLAGYAFLGGEPVSDLIDDSAALEEARAAIESAAARVVAADNCNCGTCLALCGGRLLRV